MPAHLNLWRTLRPGRPRGSALRWCLAFALLFAAQQVALGANRAATPQVELTLLGEPAIANTGTQWLALHFEIIPGWHLYWVNPGDSGAAPSVRWSLPDGWEAGPIEWPVPKRIPVGPLTNYGYEGTATLLVPIRRPVTEAAQRRIVVAEVDWLVCEVECLPQSATLQLDLATLQGQRADDAVFAEARHRLPQTLPGPAGYRLDGGELRVALQGRPWQELGIRDAWFATTTWGQIAPNATQRWQIDADGRTLRLTGATGYLPPSGEAPLADGLLVITTGDAIDGVVRGYHFTAEPGPAAGTAAAPGAARPFWTVLGLAFAGGLILNLMPCVLPVLSIKLLGFAAQARGSRLRLVEHGLLFALGVLLSFAALAGTLLALRAGGEAAGWGFQLQSPVMVTLLAALMLLVGLNLSGVFAVGHRVMGFGGSAGDGRGRLGALFNGVLATLVASPCTAPFMGAALGYAVTQPPAAAMGVFLALAGGFATPVLALSLMPAWTRWLPKPGAWTERLRHWLALPMYAAALWLVWVASQQLPGAEFAAALGALWLIGVAAWAWGQRPAGARLYAWIAAGALAAGLGLTLRLEEGSPATQASLSRAAETWSPQRVRDLQAEGRAVFVNFTAAWCISCKVNERVALDRPKVRVAMAARDVAYLKGDWTRQDPEISAELARHGRNGVPLYLVYPPKPGAAPEVLPQLLTENLILAALERL